MSAFYPLNLAEDTGVSKKEMEEQHSRELQIEQAITMYQEVLKLQKKRNLVEAYGRYSEMIKLDIINNHEIEEEDFVKGLQNGGQNQIPDQLSFISPNIKLLRYLYYRNRGMLYLDILKEGNTVLEQLCTSEETPEDKFLELAYRLIDDFCISLIYQEADEVLLSTLYDLLFYVGAYRLAKFTLEYSLSGKCESDDILSLAEVDSSIKNRYQILKATLGERSSISEQKQKFEFDRINESYKFLTPLKSDFQTQVQKTTQLKSMSVGLTESMDWSFVIDAINLQVQTHHNKVNEIPKSKSKYLDPYNYTETPIERVEFRVLEESELSNEDAVIIDDIDALPSSPKPDFAPDIFPGTNNENEVFRLEMPGDHDSKHLVNEESEAVNIDDSAKNAHEIISIDGDTVILEECQPLIDPPKIFDKSIDITMNEEDTVEEEMLEVPISVNSGALNEPEKDPKNSEHRMVDIEIDEAQEPVVSFQSDTEDRNNNYLDDDITKSNVTTLTQVGIDNEANFHELNGMEDKGHFQPNGETTDENNPKGRGKPQRMSRRLAQTEVFDLKPEIVLERRFFEETDRFYDTLREFISKLNDNEDVFVLDSAVSMFLPDHDDKEVYTFIADFVETLNNWENPLYAKYLSNDLSATRTSEDEKLKLLDVLSGFAKNNLDLAEETSELLDILNYDDGSTIKEFLLALNEADIHYLELKSIVLERLLGYTEIQGSRFFLITDTVWSSKLLSMVKDWVLQHEQILLSDFKTNKNSAEAILPISVSIHEIVADICLSIQAQISTLLLQNSQKYNKSTINSLSLELAKLRGILRNWEKFIERQFSNIANNSFELKKMEIRYRWSFINLQKSFNIHSVDNKYVIIKLQELLKIVIDHDENLEISLVNYENIPTINLKNVKEQLATLSVLSMFSRILSDSSSNNPEAINLLKAILVGESGNVQFEVADSSVTIESIIAITKFLDNSPIDMKLSLWNILFLYYSSNKNSTEFQRGFEFNLKYLLNYLLGDDYKTLNQSSRSTILIKVIGFLSGILNLYLSIIADNSWKLPNRDVKSVVMHDLLRYFEFFYMFTLHEEAAMISSLKVSTQKTSMESYNNLKSFFVRITSLLLIYYKEIFLAKAGESALTQQTIKELMSITHDQLGLRNLCDASDSFFLLMAQEIFISLEGDSKQDLAQIVFCRYHYSISIGSFSPKDHGTQSQQELDESTTIEISRFVLPQCFEKNPLLNAPKHDTKGVIEDFHEVIGDPDFDACPILARNLAVIDGFLDNTEVDCHFVRDAFHGLLGLEFAHIPKNHEIIENGLYYLTAVIAYSSFKIRKKSMQTRAVEIENIIKVLTNDLIYNTQRVESWYLLGQAYGFLVEDDLIWTADKLTFPDRKMQTANLQRKSLICYLMAINGTINTRDPKKKQLYKPIIGNLMSAFAKELYSACMKPMEMCAFKAKSHPQFIKTDTAKFDPTPKSSSVSRLLCLKVMQQSLHLAVKADSEDWTNFYYLSKVQRKLRRDPRLVLHTMLEASKLAFHQSTPIERIIEPHYTICSMTYKFFKAKELDFGEAIEILKLDPVILLSEDCIPDVQNRTDVNFYRIIVYALRKVDSYDKKHWHHKARYRLSKVLFEEFGDCGEAIEQISSLVYVKANSKTLVLIWKPENERPGKHFYYTFQYALFFIQLLSFKIDLGSLIAMFPRLRRSNSIMVMLYTAWEHICSSVCKIIRTLINVDTSFTFTDNFMQNLLYQEFTKNSKSYIEAIQREGIPKPLESFFCLLYSLNDMKKSNSGFGPTSFIDDTVVALYFKIYIYFKNRVEPQPLAPTTTEVAITDSPGGKQKKIAKRDVYPVVNEILKSFRREIETVIKENPGLYNNFVQAAQESREKASLSTKPAVMVEQSSEDATTSLQIQLEVNPGELSKSKEMLGEGVSKSADTPMIVVEEETISNLVKKSESSNGNFIEKSPFSDNESAKIEYIEISSSISLGNLTPEPAIIVPSSDPNDINEHVYHYTSFPITQNYQSQFEIPKLTEETAPNDNGNVENPVSPNVSSQEIEIVKFIPEANGLTEKLDPPQISDQIALITDQDDTDPANITVDLEASTEIEDNGVKAADAAVVADESTPTLKKMDQIIMVEEGTPMPNTVDATTTVEESTPIPNTVDTTITVEESTPMPNTVDATTTVEESTPIPNTVDATIMFEESTPMPNTVDDTTTAEESTLTPKTAKTSKRKATRATIPVENLRKSRRLR